MDELEQLLRTWSDDDHYGGGEWKLSNNSVIVIVEARSTATFTTAAEAFAEAKRFVERLTSSEWRLVNRAQLGTACEPITTEDELWRAEIDVVVQRSPYLDGKHEISL